MLGVVVVVTAVGALVAHTVYQRPAAAVATPPVVVPTESSPVPPTQEPGSPIVSVTPDVLRYPLHTQVQQLLQTYFDAINTQRYDLWRSVVTATMAKNKSERDFVAGYESTRDGSVVVYRVDPTIDGSLRVLLTFHSVQALADAPKDFQSRCIVWHVVWPLTFDPEDQRWKVDTGTTNEAPQRRAC